MRYEGEVCPYCGNAFAEGDDVVVCPECATPHHRACWFAHGHCASEEKHGADYVWHKTVVPPEPEQPEQEQRQPYEQGLDIVCPDCGKVSPNGTLRCPDCGALLVPFAMGEPPIAQFRPGFDPDEELHGMKSGDIALYCRTGGASYINKCRKREQGQRVTFNWAAFFFTPFWFFYRKLFRPGAILLGVYAALMLVTLPFAANVDEIMQQSAAIYQEALGEKETLSAQEQEQTVQKVLALYQQNRKEMAVFLALSLTRILGLGLLSGFTADGFYLKKMKKDIETVRKNNTDERAVQTILFRKGGVSLTGGFGAYLGYQLVFWLFDHFTQ